MVRQAILRYELELEGVSPESQRPVGGLGALIWIERSRVTQLLLQGVPEGNYLRLMPVLDDFMQSGESVASLVMGRWSLEARRQVATKMKVQRRKPVWCYVCGDAVENILGDVVVRCEACCLSTRGYESCDREFEDHCCLDKTNPENQRREKNDVLESTHEPGEN